MANGGTNGLTTVLELLGVRADGAGGAAGEGGLQVDLFEAEGAASPLPAPKGVSGPKGGRPLGARNKSTDEFVRFFLSQRRAPLTMLGDIYSRDLGELVSHLQEIANKLPKKPILYQGMVVGYETLTINPMDVLKLQTSCGMALLPYIHKAQPKAIEIEDKPRGIMVLGDIEDAALADADELGLGLPPVDQPMQQNQRVADAPREASDTASSDIPSNALIYNDDAAKGT